MPQYAFTVPPVYEPSRYAPLDFVAAVGKGWAVGEGRTLALAELRAGIVGDANEADGAVGEIETDPRT